MREVGVCSWSLQPGSVQELAAAVRACGLSAVQLALEPIRTGAWNESEVAEVLGQSGVRVLSGMMGFKGEDYTTLQSIRATGGVRLDEHWSENLEAAHANAELAARLGIGLVTLHAGFLPHPQGPQGELRSIMIERLRAVLRAFAARGVRVGFETGQEDAATLLSVLGELRADSPGVNFDPANMILYGMGDPVAAFRQLALSVVQVHIKDAKPSMTPGEWGEEVVAGTGAVDWRAFFDAIAELRPGVNLIIEREAGASRVADITAAAQLIADMGGTQ